MTQEKLIIFLMFLLLLELLCMRYFWLRSEKDEEEIKRLERENKELKAEIERKDRLLEAWENEWRESFHLWGPNAHPCKGCGTGWGSANSEEVHTCEETCEKLAAWNKQQKKEADHEPGN